MAAAIDHLKWPAQASAAAVASARRVGGAAGLTLAGLLATFITLAPVHETRAQAGALDVVLVLDNSGSMRQNDPDSLAPVAVRALLSRLEGDTRVGLLAFDESVRRLVPLEDNIEQARDRVLEAVSLLDYAGQRTDSPRAMERAIYELKVEGRPAADKIIVFLTDGIVDTGDATRDLDKTRWMLDDLTAEAARAGIRVFAIAFTDNADFQLIQGLAVRTEGEYFRAYTASDLDGVFDRIHDLLTRIAVPATLPEPAPAPEPEVAPQPAPLTFESTAAPASSATEDTGSALPSASTFPALPNLPDTAGEKEPPATVEVQDAAGGFVLPPVTSTTAAADEPVPTDAVEVQPEPAIPTTGDEPVTDSDAPASAAVDEASTEAALTPLPDASTSPESPPSDQRYVIGAAVGVLVLLGLCVAAFVKRRRRGSAEPVSETVPKAYLNDLAGVTSSPSYELGEHLTVVGRIQGVDTSARYIVIDEPTIGRRHALVEYKDHAYWVTDQSSLNGTYVNSARTEGSHRLKHGDRVRFHKHEFEFLMLDMFETERTMMSETVFARIADNLDEDDPEATQSRARGNGHDATAPPSAR